MSSHACRRIGVNPLHHVTTRSNAGPSVQSDTAWFRGQPKRSKLDETMIELDYRTISLLVIGGLLLSVFVLPDLVAVIIIALTLTGLALRGLQESTPDRREQTWRRGENWW